MIKGLTPKTETVLNALSKLDFIKCNFSGK